MKKQIALLLIVLLVLTLYGCNNTSDTDLKKQISALQSNANTVGDNTKAEEEKNDNKVKTVTLNTPFDVGETMNITLKSSEWCEEIYPSDTSGVYSYYKNEDGEKYFVIHGDLKNLASQTLDIQYAGKAEITINGKYKLAATMELEELDGHSFYGNATPLQTLPLIIYTSVSDELYESCKDIVLTMDLVTDDEKIGYFYQDKYPHDSFTISFNNQ